MAMRGPVLVTGAGGLLGGQVSRHLHEQGVTVHACRRAELDVTDADAVTRVIQEVKPQAVVHCAAFTNVDACETEQDGAWAVNAQAPGYVARAAGEVGAEVVAISTDYVFDGRKGKSYTEEDKPNPIQVYGRSKLAGEEQVRWACERHYIVRSAWIYGPGGRNFFSRVPELLTAGESIRAVTDQTGSPTYAPDLALAIGVILGTQAYGTYHVTNAGACTFAEFCRRALDRRGAGNSFEEVTQADLRRPAPRPANTALENRAWVDAGFDPLRAWQAAAAEFLGDGR
jgi:dTDP-4-dehydrorhamnose reductase